MTAPSLPVAMLPIDALVPSRFQKDEFADYDNQALMVADFHQQARDGQEPFLVNPIPVFRLPDGRWEMLGGHDRRSACMRAGLTEVAVRKFLHVQPDDDKTILHLFVADNAHGDKREVRRWAVEEWLRRFTGDANTVIAAKVGCTDEHVRKTRVAMEERGDIQPVGSVTGTDGVVRKRRAKTGSSRPETRSTPPAKPKDEPESAADISAVLFAKPVAPEPTPTAGEQGLDGTATESSDDVSEVGAPAGADASVGDDKNGKTGKDLPTSAQVPTGAGAPTTSVGNSEADDERGQDAPLSEDPGIGTTTFVDEGPGFALTLLETVGVLPSIDDPETFKGLRPEHRRQFLALSSWAIRIAGKCPQEAAVAA